MPDTYDVLSSGIATPAAGTDHAVVNGRLAQPGDEYQGMAEIPRVWTADALQSLADSLPGSKLTSPTDAFELHPGVRKTDADRLEVAPAPPPDSIVGDVTEARLDDDLGLVWQGELTDDAMAGQVDAGHVEVSPVVRLETEPMDDGERERILDASIRDLTIVTSGALPGNSIEPGTAEAMSADALAEAFTDDESAESDDNDGDSADAGAGEDAAPEGDDPKTADAASTPEADETNDDSNTNTDTMSDTETEISDEERGLLAQARKLDEPAVIEQDDAQRLGDADALLAAAGDVDGDVTVVAESEYDALTDRVENVESMMDSVLVEETGLKESTVDAMSFEAKAGEFEDADGEFDVDALVQTPATGDVDTDEPDNDDVVDIDALSEEERGELESLRARAETFDTIDGEHADALREEAADLAGAEDYDALAEVLD